MSAKAVALTDIHIDYFTRVLLSINRLKTQPTKAFKKKAYSSLIT